MAVAPNAEDQVRFLLDLQRLLQEGSFVATYKHALLLSIADICVERGNDSGSRLRISSEELAEKFITYYWRQAAPYQPAGGSSPGAVLKQNTGRQSAVINAVSSKRRASGGSLAQFRKDTRAWARLRREVAETVRVMPLWKLQTVGSRRLEFLYSHDPSEGKEIELKEGVAFCFRHFYGLIHELVRGAWLRFVRGVKENRTLLGEITDLSDFMFRAGRAPLEVYRPLLIEYQRGDCFYCRTPLGSRGEVDHFVPWSRYPVDFGHNFVLAHGTCNARKGDRLAAVEHLERWCERNERHGSELAVAFGERNVVHDLRASVRVTAWAYEQAEAAGSLVWRQKDELVLLPHEWRSLVASVHTQ